MNDDKLEASNPTVENDEELPVPAASSAGTSPTVTFQGNSYDLMAVVGVTIGGMVLLSCVTLNMAYYCLPVAAVVLGIIGLTTAKDSVDPERTRLLSWLSLGSGAIILALIILLIVFYLFFIIFAIASEGGGF